MSKAHLSDPRLMKIMTQSDFLKAMRETGSETQDLQSLTMLFSVADGGMNNPNGGLTFTEFAALFDLLDHPYASYDIAFRAFDQDRSGYVTASEINGQMNARQTRQLRRRKTRKSDSSGGGTSNFGAGGRAFGYMQSFYTWVQEQTTGVSAQHNSAAPSGSGADIEDASVPLTRENAGNVELSFKLDTKSDLFRRYMGRRALEENRASDDGSPAVNLNFGEFSEFFTELRKEMVLQAFEHVARPSDNTVSFQQAVDLIFALAPAHFQKFLAKNATQLLSLYGDGRVSYPTFCAYTAVLEKHPFIAAALSRRCKELGRKISRDELYAAQILEGVDLVVGDHLTPLQFQVFWDVMSRARGNVIGPEDLLTSVKWKGTMRDITDEHLDDIISKTEGSGGESKTGVTGVTNALMDFFREFLEHFALGAVAGGIGAAAVYPIDLGKTRLQNQVVKPGVEPMYKGTLDAMFKVFKGEGPVGLYRGLFPQLAGVAPEKAIKLTVNDMLRGYFSKHFGDDETSISIPMEILAGAGGGCAQVGFVGVVVVVVLSLSLFLCSFLPFSFCLPFFVPVFLTRSCFLSLVSSRLVSSRLVTSVCLSLSLSLPFFFLTTPKYFLCT
jgi:hypothetical protein